jgi:outer membrane biosynthesis protein TonB
MKITRFSRTSTMARRGAAAVEFAVSLTVLFFFVFAGIEFFRASMLRHNADCAAYEAARAAIFPGATNGDAVAAASSYLSKVGVIPATIVVSPETIDSNTPSVEAEIRISMASNSWATPSFLGDKVIIGRSRLMTERVPIVLLAAMPVPPPPPAPEPDPTPDPEPDPPPNPTPDPDPTPAPPPSPPPNPTPPPPPPPPPPIPML